MVREGYPASTVEEYLDAVPTAQGAALRTVRDRIVDVVPDAEQVISYQVPTIRYRGRGLIALSAATSHCSLHLMSPPVAVELADVLTEGTLSGATLRFDADAPLSADTVRLIAQLRMAEVDAQLG
ncbi:iron chaperone [Cellulomonas fengjieae]|uniref:DUF1801 domain-containing protein n=1 Tax=Cellulomonas fengjieae TaxID=2819978 RepID=A0ABS3SCA8_9CELL|nr:DUF1801 domain-containing protein [Cellulomonas fengjieae]MBO3083381.1 DUF1801 domain-containing protein [Cellulomonas fengjieae]QVI65278.1 DUF1801 domain-containing protein [Cellulomonas fengjieae]